MRMTKTALADLVSRAETLIRADRPVAALMLLWDETGRGSFAKAKRANDILRGLERNRVVSY